MPRTQKELELIQRATEIYSQRDTGPCTICNKGKRRFFCYDPVLETVEYYCANCFDDYVKRINEEEEEKKEKEES